MKITLNKKIDRLPSNKSTFKRGDYFLFCDVYYLVVGDWTKNGSIDVMTLRSNSYLENFKTDENPNYTRIKPVEMIFEEI